MRNAQRHLSPEDYAGFNDAWREILAASESKISAVMPAATSIPAILAFSPYIAYL
jgi:hypothetical protein